MAIKCFSVHALFLVSFALTAQRTTVTAIPEVPKREAQNLKMEEPDCVDDRSFLIPGIGRAVKPTPHGTGRPGDVGDSRPTPRYIPGNDDTFVPNPGFEVPAVGGGVPGGNNGP
ncbi:putative cell wall protein [Nymphaea colorata]|uniref:putative cell wall protein n=1 Tax=Nymphaea colorata TaxID=210225 RepID=UPI00129EBAD2|nr:putative cell wall protein [Nymphaea colorata]